MSGLKALGGLYGFSQGSMRVTPDEIDRHERIHLFAPAVSTTYIGTAAGGTSTQQKALVLLNAYPDWPRNLLYSVVGTSDMGGTWTINGFDQFGNPATESVGFGTAAAGTPAGSAFGTVIFSKISSGTFTYAGVGSGSAQLGVGTVSNGSAQSNWFGLLTKIAGTGDVKSITWITTNTPTALNAGTAIGTLVNVARHAFQGTSGVAATDRYTVIIRPTYDNSAQTANLAV